jgi:hypothetical protein
LPYRGDRGDIVERGHRLAEAPELAAGQQHGTIVRLRQPAGDHHQPIGIAEIERLQQDGANDAEHRSVQADADGERQDD